MVTLQEAHTAVSGADGELSAPEDTAGEHKIAERRLVDTLLDISEENFLNETEPDEYHCYSGWEDAVCGWARVAPLSCILVTSNPNKKPKYKEADNGSPSPDGSTAFNANSSASIAAEQYCKSHVGLDNLKKFGSVNQQMGAWSESALAAHHAGAAEWPVLNAMQRKKAHLLLEEKTVERGMHAGTPQLPHLSSKYSVAEKKPAKPKKYNYRTNNRVVPITNFTFLPPIKSPQVISKASGYFCRGTKTPEGQTSEKNRFILEKRRGTRVDTAANSDLSTFSAALTSKYQTYWQNPHNVSIPRRLEYDVSQT